MVQFFILFNILYLKYQYNHATIQLGLEVAYLWTIVFKRGTQNLLDMVRVLLGELPRNVSRVHPPLAGVIAPVAGQPQR